MAIRKPTSKSSADSITLEKGQAKNGNIGYRAILPLSKKDDIKLPIKKISIDTSPGSDGIVLRTIRNVKCANTLWAIEKVMLE